jgi:hypothetical protein
VLGENPHFLAKPYTLPAIARKVRQVLDENPKESPAQPVHPAKPSP